MKKFTLIIYTIMTFVFVISGFFTQVGVVANHFIYSDDMFSEVVLLLPKDNQVVTTNSDVISYLNKNKITLSQTIVTNEKILKKMIINDNKYAELLHLENGTPLTEENYYSTDCANDVSCDNLAYQSGNAEVRYIFENGQFLTGNYMIDRGSATKEDVENFFVSQGYTVRFGVHESQKSLLERDQFQKINIVQQLLNNIPLLILIFFLTLYIVTVQSKKLGIKRLLGFTKKQQFIKLILEQNILFLISFLTACILYFFILFIQKNSVYFNIKEYFLFLFIMEATIIISMGFIGVVALNSNLSILLRDGFKANKLLTFLKFIIQILLITTTASILISSFSLIAEIDKTDKVLNGSDSKFYSEASYLASFSLGYRWSQQDEEKKRIELQNEVDTNSSSIQNLNEFFNKNKDRIAYQQMQDDTLSKEEERIVPKSEKEQLLFQKKYVFANAEYLNLVKFPERNRCNVEVSCIFVGKSDESKVEEIKKYIQEKNNHTKGVGSRIYEIVIYNDDEAFSFYQFRARQDFNNKVIKKSPIIVTEPISTMRTQERISKLLNIGFLFVGSSSEKVNDEFYTTLSETNSTEWLSIYENTYQEYLGFRIENLQLLFRFFISFIFIIILCISILMIHVVTTLKGDKKRIAIEKLLGFSWIRIVIAYLLSILIIGLIVAVFLFVMSYVQQNILRTKPFTGTEILQGLCIVIGAYLCIVALAALRHWKREGIVSSMKGEQ